MLRLRLICLIALALALFAAPFGCATLFVDLENLSGGQAADAGNGDGTAVAEAGTDALATLDGGDPFPLGDGGALSGILAYRAAVIADEPLVYYALDDSIDSLVALDQRGRANGTYVGNIVRNPNGLVRAGAGAVNHAVDVQGFGVIRVDGSGLDLTGFKPVTIELWAKRNAFQDDHRYAVFKENTGSGTRRGVAFWFHNGVISMERYVANLGNFVTVNDVPIETVIHGVGTYDGQNIRIYINGELKDTRLDVRAMNLDISEPLLLGSGDASGSSEESIVGTLDEIAIYDKALPPERIKAHYDLGR